MIDFRKDIQNVYRAEYAGRGIFICQTDPKDFEKMDPDWAWAYGVKSMLYGDGIILGHAPSFEDAKKLIITYMDATLRYV